MNAEHMNPSPRSHATALARQACARVFRDGGAPTDALEAFGLAGHETVGDWAQAIDLIAAALCAQPQIDKVAA